MTVFDKADSYYDADGNPVTDPEQAAYATDYVGLRGMFPKTVEKYGVANVIDFEYYEGFIYSLMTQMKPTAYQGTVLYPTNFYYFVAPQGLGATLGNGAMIGGFCDDGVVAFVSNPQFGAEIIAMGLCYFKTANYSDDGALFTEEAHAYPMLVSPDSPVLSDASAAAQLKAPASCERVSMALQADRRNYVETDRGYIRSTIDMMKEAPYNYMERAMASDVQISHVTVDCSVATSTATVVADGQIKKGDWMETLKK